jgi:hypothetical protein
MVHFGCLALNVYQLLMDQQQEYPLIFTADIPADIESKQFCDLLSAIMKIFLGKALDLTKYEPSVVKSVCSIFGIIHFLPFLIDKFDFAQEESIVNMVVKNFLFYQSNSLNLLTMNFFKKFLHLHICSFIQKSNYLVLFLMILRELIF